MDETSECQWDIIGMSMGHRNMGDGVWGKERVKEVQSDKSEGMCRSYVSWLAAKAASVTVGPLPLWGLCCTS